MTMSRKDYRLLADALLEARPEIRGNPGPDFRAWLLTRNMIASALNVANRNFDREKFEDWTNK